MLFTASYGDLCGHSVAQRQAALAVTPSLQSAQALLFFTLFSLKAGVTYDVLGFGSGRDAAHAKRHQPLGWQGWEACLRPVDGWPQRRVATVAECAEDCQREETLIFDGVERRIQRPRETEAQKDHYSGKKSTTPSKR